MEATINNPLTGYRVQKDVSEVYRIRLDSYRCQWANITINSSGDFSAITDCGNFNYQWSGYGSGTFKEFLIRILTRNAKGNGSYVYEKISDDSRDLVDCKKTVKTMRKEFIEKYRELYKEARSRVRWANNFDTRWALKELQEKARSTWDALENIEAEGTLSKDRFFSLIWEGSLDNLFFDGDYLAHCLDVEMTGDR